MPKDLNRGDLEYGSPSFERGVKYSFMTTCSSFELLKYVGSNGTVFHSSIGELDDTSLEGWLLKDVTKLEASSDGLNETFNSGLRLILCECAFEAENDYRILPFTEEKFNIISNHFQLPPQFIPSTIATFSRCYKISCSPSRSSAFKPTTCFVYGAGVFEIGQYHMCISYSPKQNLTYALVLFKPRFNLPSPFSTIIQNLTTNCSLALYPLFLPLLIADLSIESSTPRIRSINQRLNDLERAAGQHEWADLTQGDPLNLDFASATKQLNFMSRGIGAEIWRCKSNLLVLENIEAENDLLLGFKSLQDEGRSLKELIAYHTNTCQNLILRAEFEDKRLQTQIAVVYQFMAQKDSRVNLELAETTNIIAKESKKDSSAMKAIAMLTMCFLPGTFLATLFAMPFFNWEQDDRPVIKDGFKYYWAIAIPLTLLVLAIWATGMLLPWQRWFDEAHRKRKEVDVEAGSGKRIKTV